MSLEAISMEPVKDKLKNLRKYMPGEDKSLYEFAEFVADRLNPRLVPAGFNVAFQLAIHDLRTGKDGYTREPVKCGLVGYPAPFYVVMQMRIPDIAKAVCPEDFAKEVEEIRDIVTQA